MTSTGCGSRIGLEYLAHGRGCDGKEMTATLDIDQMIGEFHSRLVHHRRRLERCSVSPSLPIGEAMCHESHLLVDEGQQIRRCRSLFEPGLAENFRHFPAMIFLR